MVAEHNNEEGRQGGGQGWRARIAGAPQRTQSGLAFLATMVFGGGATMVFRALPTAIGAGSTPEQLGWTALGVASAVGATLGALVSVERWRAAGRARDPQTPVEAIYEAAAKQGGDGFSGLNPTALAQWRGEPTEPADPGVVAAETARKPSRRMRAGA
jgi:hypothetical protein